MNRRSKYVVHWFDLFRERPSYQHFETRKGAERFIAGMKGCPSDFTNFRIEEV